MKTGGKGVEALASIPAPDGIAPDPQVSCSRMLDQKNSPSIIANYHSPSRRVCTPCCKPLAVAGPERRGPRLTYAALAWGFLQSGLLQTSGLVPGWCRVLWPGDCVSLHGMSMVTVSPHSYLVS